MDEWRSVRDNISEPKMHFAVEEALLRRADEKSSPNTLRLRRVEPSVFIGVYQDPRDEVDLEYCRKNDIPIIRRPNPGGAVYQDRGTFCYSLFSRKEELFSHLDIDDPSRLYDILGEAVVETCDRFGVDAELSGINDVKVDGSKIYGSAQIEWYSGMVHSGTFLVDVDKDDLDNALTPDELKFEDKEQETVKDRVVNLDELVDEPVNVDGVMNILKKEISSVLDIDLTEGELTEEEIDDAQELYRKKYSLDSWTYEEQETRSATVSTKGESGVILLSADMEGDVIKEISLKGDFMVADQRELERVMDALTDTTFSDSIDIIDRSSLEEHFKEDMKKLIERMVKRYG